MIGSGIDIIEIKRFREARFPSRLAEYFLLAEEIDEMNSSRDTAQYMASRFAAKEAIIKSFPSPLGYKDFRIAKNADKPCVIFAETGLDDYCFFLSISHSFEYATAWACALRK